MDKKFDLFFELLLDVPDELFNWLCHNRKQLSADVNFALDAILALADG